MRRIKTFRQIVGAAAALSLLPVGACLAQGKPTEITCLIEPSMEVNVGSPVDGVIEQMPVDRGDVVNAGQLLARLNLGVEAAALDIQQAKAQFGTRKRERNEELQAKQLISPQELDEITTEQKLSELELRERSERLKLRSIFSPFKGVVVDVFRHRGDLVHQEKILRLAQLDPLYVETVLPARLFGTVKLGQSYDVTSDLTRIRHKAKVSNVDKVIDAASGTFRVRLLLPNPRYDLPSGQRCSVNF